MQKVLGKEDAEKPKPRTIRDRINDLQHKQYIKGAQIFATQYTTMHKCAETNNLSVYRSICADRQIFQRSTSHPNLFSREPFHGI